MTDKEKLRLIEKIATGDLDWLASWRSTFHTPPGHGCPSGLTGSETTCALIRNVIEGKPVSVILRHDRPYA